MRYGSLTISQADGSMAEFGIEDVSATIGRGAGNTFSVDHPSLDERHARVAIEGGNLMVEDLGSRTGVFVDGVRIPPRTPTMVPDNGSLRFGDVDAVYHLPVRGGGVSGTDSGTVGPAPAAVRRGRLDLALVPARVSVEPGSTAYVRMEMQNTGTVVDEVRLELQGLDPGWIEMPAETMRLLPGERAERTIAITPPRSEEARAGERPFSVRAASVASEGEVSAEGVVEVGAYAEVSFEMTPVRGDGPFSIALASRANQPVSLSLDARDDEAGLVYEFDNPFVTLEPGDEATVRLDVQPSERGLFGQPQVVPFTVTATRTDGGDESAFTAQGQLQVTPPLERYKRPAMVLLPLLVLGLIGVAAYLLFRGGGDDGDVDLLEDRITPEQGTPEPVDAVEAFHLCALEAAERPPQHSGPGLSVFDANFDGFAQNDPRWGAVEYAHARTAAQQVGAPQPFWCGDTLAQCGCALTSMATVMGMLDLAVLPNNNELSPPSLNDWYRQDATFTNGGWVSRGYIYGNVLWTAVNGLSAEMNRLDSNVPRMRFSHFGQGTEAEIRADLDRGRPVILEVPGHFVAAIGVTPDGGIRIKDPSYANRTVLDDYAGQVIKSVHFEPTFNSQAVAVSVPMHLRVRITDEHGNQVGTLEGGSPDEMEAQFANDIPGASFTIERAWRDPTCEFSPPGPDQGTVQVVLTGDSDYTVEVVDPEGGDLSWSVHVYDPDGASVQVTGDDPVFEIDKVGDLAVETPTPEPATPTPTVTPTVGPAMVDVWLQDAQGEVLEEDAMVQPGDELSVCLSSNQPVDLRIEFVDPAGQVMTGPSFDGVSGESCPATVTIEQQDAPGPWTLRVQGPTGTLGTTSFVVERVATPTPVPRMSIASFNAQGAPGHHMCQRRHITWIIDGDPQGSATLIRQHNQGGNWVTGKTLVNNQSPPGITASVPNRYHFTVTDSDALAVTARYLLTVRNRFGQTEATATSDTFPCLIIVN